MDKKKVLPSLVCGFGAAVLSTVPGIKSLGCCLIIPLAAVLALYLDIRINKSDLPVTFKTAAAFGVLTGIFAAFFATFFDVLITYIAHTNDFVDALPQTEAMIRQYKLGAILDQTMQLLKMMSEQIKNNGFSAMYTFGIFVSNMFINTIFGFLGGMIGMSFINKRVRN